MFEFRVAAAQVSSIRGDLARNIATHQDAIAAAAEHGVSVLVFPELSLMGYEPDLADVCAMSPTDSRLAPLASLASLHQMHIVVGAAIENGQNKPFLGAFVFDGAGSIDVYRKVHLGGSESDYFAAGNSLMQIESQGQSIGLSICADSSQPSHPASYASQGASIYAASVFLNAQWYASDSPRFPKYASEFSMLVLMANHGSSNGSLESVGNSAVWEPDGSLLAEVAGTQSALVIASRRGDDWVGEVVRL